LSIPRSSRCALADHLAAVQPGGALERVAYRGAVGRTRAPLAASVHQPALDARLRRVRGSHLSAGPRVRSLPLLPPLPQPRALTHTHIRTLQYYRCVSFGRFKPDDLTGKPVPLKLAKFTNIQNLVVCCFLFSNDKWACNYLGVNYTWP
jgi:hypothetical protein